MENTESQNLDQSNRFKRFFSNLESCQSEHFMKIVENHVSDHAIEAICDHIETFYGVEDDEEIGMLAQVMITGVLIGKNEDSPITFIQKH